MVQRNVDLANGTAVPIVGFGTWQITGKNAEAAVACALQYGYRHIDTATVYENEKEVGRAIADGGLARHDLYVTTKLPPDSRSVRKTIEASLADLGLDYVDLWLIHWPPRHASSVKLFEEMLQIRDEGLVRSVGVSNFSIAMIDELTASLGETPVVNQIPWSPFLHDPTERRLHDERHVALEGYSPLRESDLNNLVLQQIASRSGVTPAQVVLHWHLEHGIVVLPKSVHEERIAENIDLFDFTLDVGEIAQLDALSGY